MERIRRSFSKEYKAKVALEALKGMKTINELASEYSVHPNAIINWKKQLLNGMAGIFESKKEKTNQEKVSQEELYQQIGKLQVELEWLKKKHELIG